MVNLDNNKKHILNKNNFFEKNKTLIFFLLFIHNGWASKKNKYKSFINKGTPAQEEW